MADPQSYVSFHRSISAVRQDERQSRAAAVWDEVAEERQALEARTSRLRAMRQARETGDRTPSVT